MINVQAIRRFSAAEKKTANSYCESGEPSVGDLWMRRLVRQSKKLSQLIAASWMTEESDYPGESRPVIQLKIAKAKAIQNIFIGLRVGSPEHSQQCYKALEQLFLGKKYLDSSECPEHKSKSDRLLWGKIFDQKELGRYQFDITWNSFDGKLIEHPQFTMKPIQSKDEGECDLTSAPFFTLVLPYPPKPSSFGLEVQRSSDFRKWVQDPVDVDDSTQTVSDPFPPIAYVPLTTC